MDAALLLDSYSTVKIKVFWDLQSCPLPEGHDGRRIFSNLRNALWNMHYRGPISISVYGDAMKIPSCFHEEAWKAAHVVNVVPSGVGVVRMPERILSDVLFWAMDNPAPANCLLISNDFEFPFTLHQLRFRMYNVMLVSSHSSRSQALADAAKYLWIWKEVVALPA
ncbi:unnamed protein product [Rhodiola kirilowii]